eukprot:TRINITY_DN287_c0_g1_i1.p1 TRINITY_DN287_c0_g1~~TRINITY_DN287_c0_g1_i1.p1  ORF type:complete len:155 (-),score=53.28 TRINITY_DN287_c0_g1_i1:96-560(-)
MDKDTLKIDGKEAIIGAKNEMLTPTSSSGWIILGYTNPTTVALQSKGSGGVDEMVANIDEEQVQYCLVRLEERDKDIANVNRQDGKKPTRDIFVAWIGNKVRTIEKGKKSLHAAAVAQFLQPFHAELTAVNKDNFNEANVRDRAAALSGSHVID